MTRTSRAAGLGGQLRLLSFSTAHNGISPADHPVDLFRTAFGALDLYLLIGLAEELLKKLPTSGTAELKNRHVLIHLLGWTQLIASKIFRYPLLTYPELNLPQGRQPVQLPQVPLLCSAIPDRIRSVRLYRTDEFGRGPLK